MMNTLQSSTTNWIASTTEAEPVKRKQLAPNVFIINNYGAQVPLASYWRERPTLLFFMRHFGCAVCRAQLLRVRDTYAEITQRGGHAVAIAQTEYEATLRFTRGYRLPFPVLSDPTLAAYRAFGLSEGKLREVSSPQVMARQAAETLKGNVAYVLPSFSLTQLGGTFIVDQSGSIQLAHVAQPIYNYPDVARYFEVFESLHSHV